MFFSVLCSILRDCVAVVTVELTESMWSFSNDLGYPAGVMGEKLGTRCTLVVALLLVVTVYMLLWAAQYSVHVYVTHQWLFYICYFLLGECARDRV